MKIEKDILRNLNKGPRTYEGLKRDFPRVDVAQLLIEMEEQHLVVNKGGAWFITEGGKKTITEGKKKVGRKKQIAKKVAYSLLVVPVIFFFLQSASFNEEYTDALNHNAQLLQEKTETEQQLSSVNMEKEGVEAEYVKKMDELKGEQDATAQLNTPLEEAQHVVNSLKNELNRYQCLETCTPDKFVTVDNEYVKAKVDEICAGLTSLREKQEAVYKFVRDEIKDDESTFCFGRLDMWEYPEDILKRGKGHWEDKFLLLLTMLRIAGTPPEHAKFIAAEVDGNDNWLWVEAYDGATWWVLDPFEGYEFTSNPKEQFYEEHEVIILWWFNDTEFRRG
ncbi:MAG: transglutaminase domain-containing protein [Theionarchaea archaeon]|nr:MAG: hypothetical protein AYK19_13010 [Theionarchaea archaeon DG-70-1]MBU7029703.1 transglutaminase domain-containing protein [Theionarchaea archaeon]